MYCGGFLLGGQREYYSEMELWRQTVKLFPGNSFPEH